MAIAAGDNVLVTGAGGFIGSHLTEALVERGARVRAFLHYGSAGGYGLLDVLPSPVRGAIDVVSGDLRDADAVRRAARGAGTIFHLGALVGIPYSYLHPRDVTETNVLGTLNVLEAARENEARVVHTSTSEVYGSARYVPIDEAHPLQAQSPYAASKIAADQIAISYFRSFNLRVAVARPFNTYGPRQSTRAIIPTIISQALAGRTLKLGALTPTRDLNYVTDTAAGFLRIAESDQALGAATNIGSGRETSIAELIRLIGDIVGRRLEVEQDAQRLRPPASEVDRLVADSSRLRTLCGWEPKVTLEQGLARTVEWMRANPQLHRPEVYGV